MNRNLLLALAGLVVVVGAIWWFLIHANSTAPAINQNPSSTSSGSASTTQNSVTITYNGSGFSPSTVTVKAGGTVTVTNSSSSPVQLDSNPHPAHTDNTELNIGSIQPGQSQTFSVSKVGTWGYHNHLSPNQGGTIIVQ